MKQISFEQLCKKMFFSTGEIGYYLLWKEIEKTKLDEEVAQK